MLPKLCDKRCKVLLDVRHKLSIISYVASVVASVVWHRLCDICCVASVVWHKLCDISYETSVVWRKSVIIASA